MLTLLRLIVRWTVLHSLLPTALFIPDAHSRDTPTWHRYVRAPSSRTVAPKAILSQYTKGNVTGPEAIISGGTELTHLTRPTNASEVPTIVVDFGQNVVGLLEIAFAGSESYGAGGYPGLKLSFSETLEFLTNRSDFTRSDNADGVCQIGAGPGDNLLTITGRKNHARNGSGMLSQLEDLTVARWFRAAYLSADLIRNSHENSHSQDCNPFANISIR
jgi:hypothetical protein